jgi:mannose/fructose/N-acetylgalactosamine-specific phosphotransferase system component IIC
MNILLISILGAAILLDKYAFGEFGISQPIVTGTIIGAIFGDIVSGIFLGAMLQLIFLVELPIGRDIPPDGQAAGFVGCASYFLLKMSNSIEQSLLLAIVIALFVAIVGTLMEIFTRRLNERLYHRFMRKKEHLVFYHFSGLLTSFARGIIICLPILVIAYIIVLPDGFPRLSKEIFTIVAISIGIANGIYLFVKKMNVIYLIFGGICGLALLVI